ncbi:MAG: hypothetical protein GX589_09790, partial [Deltaproteobacteria bacterium]|nr:hypothetical protein [Deltaproteobacteria bacterium]
MPSWVLKSVLLAGFLTLTAMSYQMASSSAARLSNKLPKDSEVLYLPNGKGLEFISFGFKNALADILWFNTISYFGKHYRLDRDYTWLDHMCSLITELDPHARHIFEFCSLMLAWEAKKTNAALTTLSRALKAEPKYWRYYYLRGMTYAFFLKDSTLAREDFIAGARLPGAPVFMAKLASKKMALGDPDTAIEFLQEVIASASDETQRH